MFIESPDLEIVLTCAFNGGAGIVNVAWSGPAVQLQPATVQIDTGTFISNLILTNATMFLSGFYQCTAGYDNSLCTSSVSSNVRLDVVATPSIAYQMQSPYVVERGENLSLLFVFATHPSFTDIQCSGPNGDINVNTSSTSLVRDDNFTAFQLKLVIHISVVNHTHGGIYSCCANNSAGDIHATVTVVVRPVAEPEITLARKGDSVILMCLAQSFPSPSYMWEIISQNDSSGSGSLLDALEPGSGENQMVTLPILEFNPVQYEDNGNYRCVITFNGIWQVSSNEISLAGR